MDEANDVFKYIMYTICYALGSIVGYFFMSSVYYIIINSILFFVALLWCNIILKLIQQARAKK